MDRPGYAEYAEEMDRSLENGRWDPHHIASLPRVKIEGTGEDRFVVNSIVLKSAEQTQASPSYKYLLVRDFTTNDGPLHFTPTGNIFAPHLLEESADIMGMLILIDREAQQLDNEALSTARNPPVAATFRMQSLSRPTGMPISL